MSKCEVCKADCVFKGEKDLKPECRWFIPMTNADRIRAMSDEELMGFLFNEVSCGSICEFCVPVPRKSTKCDGHCRNGILEWLQQPVKEDA